MPNSLMEWAIHYAESGFPVFPCRPNTKEPFGKDHNCNAPDHKHGCYDATTDEDTIMAWWEEHPNANIAIHTKDLLVVDVDGADNPWLKDESELYTELSINAVCKTPGEGTHFWFSQQKDRPVNKNSVGKLAKSVDTRIEGGYVLVPPSYVVVDKEKKKYEGHYEWVGMQALGMRSELTEVPNWLMTLLERDQETLSSQLSVGNTIVCGERNDTLFRMGSLLRRYGCSEIEIYSLLSQMNQNRCDIPMEETEVQGIAKSAARYPPEQLSVAYMEGWDNIYGHKEEVFDDEIPDPGDLPIELIDVPGLIGEVMEYNLKTAFRRQPELALGAALCLMATITGRKVEDNRGTRTNLYCIGVAASGSGKEHARKVNKNILHQSGADEFIAPEGFGSHAGIISAIDAQPVSLFQIDEFGRLLQTLKNPQKAPHLFNVITVLLKLYTSADSVYVSDALADLKRVKKIYQPHAVLYTTTVPESFYSGLTSENLNDGFLSRVVCLFAANNLPEDNRPEKQPIPESIIESVREWVGFHPGGNLSSENPQPYEMEVTQGAEQIFHELSQVCRSYQSGLYSDYAAMWTRVEEKSRTLAMLYSCSRDGTSAPVVDRDAAEWACTVVEHLTKQLIHKSQDHIAENEQETKTNRVLRIIKDAGADGISKTKLTRKTQFLKARERDDILATLMDSMKIKGELPAGNLTARGRTTMVYTAM